jgi:uncharacterized membrane protein YGL010W
MAKKHTDKRKVDLVLENFDSYHQHPNNRSIQWLCILLLTFGFLGIVWAIPFPKLEFLGRYNGYVNWASFLIAFSIYYYYKLSPVLSYGILLIVFAFSACIVTLERLHREQGIPSMALICLTAFTVGLILQFAGHRFEGRSLSLAQQFRTLLNGPLWLMARIFQRFGIKA